MSITKILSDYSANLKLSDLPPDVVTRTRFLLLDLVGNIIRARYDAESTPAMLAAVRALGLGQGQSGVFGDPARYSPVGAALLNGALAHSLDFDDTHAAGSLQFLANGAWTKRFQVGWAAAAGLTAATLAREGFKGAADALEGKAGFLRAYAPDPVPERAIQDLGHVFELMRTAVKPYPSCRYGHAGIDAMLALRAEHKLQPGEVERIVYGTSRSGMMLVGEPPEKRANPQNVVDGQFSGPFALSTALVTGAMGWDSYRELQNPAIRALLPKVICEDDADAQAVFPDKMAGKVTVTARGQTFSKFITDPKGEPENFLTEAELRAKFAGLTDAVLTAPQAAKLADVVLGVHLAADVSALLRAAVPLAEVKLAG